MSDAVEVDEQLADLIILLWSEIPLSLESKVVQRMHDEGVYEAWEAVMNANPSAIVGTPQDWLDGLMTYDDGGRGERA